MENTVNEGFYILKYSILECSELDITEKVLYSIIDAYTRQDKPCTWSNATFAAKIDVNEATISRKITTLKKKGFIYIDNGKGHNRKLVTLNPKLASSNSDNKESDKDYIRRIRNKAS